MESKLKTKSVVDVISGGIVFSTFSCLLLQRFFNVLIAILTDNFRRISENIQSEYTFGKAELVQRITRRVSLAHPPLNVLQPLFFFFGDKQQELPIGYPVEALFTPPRNAVRDAAAAAAEKDAARGATPAFAPETDF